MTAQYSPLPPERGTDPAEYAFAELQDLVRSMEEAQNYDYLQELHAEPARPREGMIVLADGTDWNPGEGSGFYGYRDGEWRLLDAAITSYTAASVTKNTGGTATGTVSSTQTMLDGSVYNVVEAASTPGYDIEFAWSGIVFTPTELILRCKYNGSSTHRVTVDIYRYSGTPGWDNLGSVRDGLDYDVMVIALPAMGNYLSAGAAKIRLYHHSAGNASHDISIDYIAFTNISAGGSAVSGGSGANLTYTASTRVLASDTGTDVTLPLVTTSDAGLAPATGGGTTKFLRADATWETPVLSALAAPVASVDFSGQQATSFRIENRTSDPGAPTTGQIWLRTDL